MLPLPKGAVWQTLFLISALLFIKEARSEGRVVCYYTNWSVYRPGTAKFNPQNINPYLCTHLIYAFGGFTKDNTLKPFDKYQDIEKGGYSKFTGLKSYNKNLKTLLAIGGWNEGSSRFSPLVASPERRQQFIKNILKFLRQNHFDGLDLDWEYPAHRDGGKPRDKENYAQFVQELRSEFDRESAKTGRPRLLLTMAVPAGVQYIEKGYDIPKLNKYLDWFNLLSYDYHSAYEPSVNHHSPLYSLEEASEYNYEGDLNIDYTIKFYLEAGADRDKLVLGIPTYGRSYTLINEEDTEIGAPADGPGDQGDATREKGYLAYYEICQNLREDPDWTVVQPNPKAMGPYAFKGNQWVGYDDEGIVRRKAEFVAENHLGGIMFWSIDNDDFRGSCTGKPYPLIEAAKDAMLDRLGVGDNEVARPSKPKKPQRGRSRLNSSSDRNRIGSDSGKEEVVITKKATTGRRTSNRRKTTAATTATTTTTTTTPSSLYIGGRTTTPAPPTTPDPGADFKCEEEGFFPHPRDCKKYFWCLDSGPSNLGIVAHQFTCPSGLYFNTAADSCDFTRNVLCKTSKKTTTAKPVVTTPSTTTTTTTTTRPRITAATSRNSFLRRVTSTTTTEAPYEEEEEEYIDEEEIDEDSNRTIDSEEDPKVIKELIDLIKKVGGLEELEKQLQLQEDGSMALKNAKTQAVSTTPSSISKSLYAKVLSRPNNLKTFQSRFSAAALSKTTEEPTVIPDEVDEEETQSDRSSGNKYSSVIRNSRPGPQNAGIDKLAEFEGFFREKPKYVTIHRTRPTLPISTTDDQEDVEEHDKVEVVDSEEIEEEEPRIVEGRRRIATTRITTASPSYVSIRRTRPTTAAPEKEDKEDERVSEVDEEGVAQVTSRTSYQFLSRRRGTTTTSLPEVEETVTPTAAQNRYKTIERTRRVSTIAPENHDISEDIVRERGSASYVTVEDSGSKQDTLESTTTTTTTTQDKSITTQPSRVYAKISRRTTTAEPTVEPLQSTVIPVEDTTEPTTVGTTQSSSTATTTTTTTPVPTTIPTLSSHETTLSPETETVPTNLDTVSRQSDIASLSLLSTTQTLGLNKEDTQYTLTDTTKFKDETNIATVVDDEEQVKKTSIGGVENDVNSSRTSNKPNTQLTSSAISKDSSLNVYKESSTLSEVDSSHSHQLKETKNSSDKQTETKETADDAGQLLVEVTSTQRTPVVRTRRPLFRGTTTTTTTANPETTTEFLGTVSSPRPFGFPRRRLRPSSKFTPSTTNAPESSASVTTSTNIDNSVQEIDTNTSTKKVSPVTNYRVDVKRRYFNGSKVSSSLSSINASSYNVNDNNVVESPDNIGEVIEKVEEKVVVGEKHIGITGNNPPRRQYTSSRSFSRTSSVTNSDRDDDDGVVNNDGSDNEVGYSTNSDSYLSTPSILLTTTERPRKNDPPALSARSRGRYRPWLTSTGADGAEATTTEHPKLNVTRPFRPRFQTLDPEYNTLGRETEYKRVREFSEAERSRSGSRYRKYKLVDDSYINPLAIKRRRPPTSPTTPQTVSSVSNDQDDDEYRRRISKSRAQRVRFGSNRLKSGLTTTESTESGDQLTRTEEESGSEATADLSESQQGRGTGYNSNRVRVVKVRKFGTNAERNNEGQQNVAVKRVRINQLNGQRAFGRGRNRERNESEIVDEERHFTGGERRTRVRTYQRQPGGQSRGDTSSRSTTRLRTETRVNKFEVGSARGSTRSDESNKEEEQEVTTISSTEQGVTDVTNETTTATDLEEVTLVTENTSEEAVTSSKKNDEETQTEYSVRGTADRGAQHHATIGPGDVTSEMNESSVQIERGKGKFTFTTSTNDEEVEDSINKTSASVKDVSENVDNEKESRRQGSAATFIAGQTREENESQVHDGRGEGRYTIKFGSGRETASEGYESEYDSIQRGKGKYSVGVDSQSQTVRKEAHVTSVSDFTEEQNAGGVLVERGEGRYRTNIGSTGSSSVQSESEKTNLQRGRGKYTVKVSSREQTVSDEAGKFRGTGRYGDGAVEDNAADARTSLHIIQRGKGVSTTFDKGEENHSQRSHTATSVEDQFEDTIKEQKDGGIQKARGEGKYSFEITTKREKVSGAREGGVALEDAPDAGLIRTTEPSDAPTTSQEDYQTETQTFVTTGAEHGTTESLEKVTKVTENGHVGTETTSEGYRSRVRTETNKTIEESVSTADSLLRQKPSKEDNEEVSGKASQGRGESKTHFIKIVSAERTGRKQLESGVQVREEEVEEARRALASGRQYSSAFNDGIPIYYRNRNGSRSSERKLVPDSPITYIETVLSTADRKKYEESGKTVASTILTNFTGIDAEARKQQSFDENLSIENKYSGRFRPKSEQDIGLSSAEEEKEIRKSKRPLFGSTSIKNSRKKYGKTRVEVITTIEDETTDVPGTTEEIAVKIRRPQVSTRKFGSRRVTTTTSEETEGTTEEPETTVSTAFRRVSKLRQGFVRKQSQTSDKADSSETDVSLTTSDVPVTTEETEPVGVSGTSKFRSSFSRKLVKGREQALKKEDESSSASLEDVAVATKEIEEIEGTTEEPETTISTAFRRVSKFGQGFVRKQSQTSGKVDSSETDVSLSTSDLPVTTEETEPVGVSGTSKFRSSFSRKLVKGREQALKKEDESSSASLEDVAVATKEIEEIEGTTEEPETTISTAFRRVSKIGQGFVRKQSQTSGKVDSSETDVSFSTSDLPVTTEQSEPAGVSRTSKFRSSFSRKFVKGREQALKNEDESSSTSLEDAAVATKEIEEIEGTTEEPETTISTAFRRVSKFGQGFVRKQSQTSGKVDSSETDVSLSTSDLPVTTEQSEPAGVSRTTKFRSSFSRKLVKGREQALKNEDESSSTSLEDAAVATKQENERSRVKVSKFRSGTERKFGRNEEQTIVKQEENDSTADTFDSSSLRTSKFRSSFSRKFSQGQGKTSLGEEDEDFPTTEATLDASDNAENRQTGIRISKFKAVSKKFGQRETIEERTEQGDTSVKGGVRISKVRYGIPRRFDQNKQNASTLSEENATEQPEESPRTKFKSTVLNRRYKLQSRKENDQEAVSKNSSLTEEATTDQVQKSLRTKLTSTVLNRRYKLEDENESSEQTEENVSKAKTVTEQETESTTTESEREIFDEMTTLTNEPTTQSYEEALGAATTARYDEEVTTVGVTVSEEEEEVTTQTLSESSLVPTDSSTESITELNLSSKASTEPTEEQRTETEAAKEEGSQIRSRYGSRRINVTHQQTNEPSSTTDEVKETNIYKSTRTRYGANSSQRYGSRTRTSDAAGTVQEQNDANNQLSSSRRRFRPKPTSGANGEIQEVPEGRVRFKPSSQRSKTLSKSQTDETAGAVQTFRPLASRKEVSSGQTKDTYVEIGRTQRKKFRPSKSQRGQSLEQAKDEEELPTGELLESSTEAFESATTAEDLEQGTEKGIKLTIQSNFGKIQPENVDSTTENTFLDSNSFTKNYIDSSTLRGVSSAEEFTTLNEESSTGAFPTTEVTIEVTERVSEPSLTVFGTSKSYVDSATIRGITSEEELGVQTSDSPTDGSGIDVTISTYPSSIAEFQATTTEDDEVVAVSEATKNDPITSSIANNVDENSIGETTNTTVSEIDLTTPIAILLQKSTKQAEEAVDNPIVNEIGAQLFPSSNLESNTRRTYSLAQRPGVGGLRATIQTQETEEEEKDEEEEDHDEEEDDEVVSEEPAPTPSTRRPFGGLNRSRLRVRPTTESGTEEDTVRVVDSTTGGVTRKTFSVLNRQRFRTTTTEKEEEDEEETSEASVSTPNPRRIVRPFGRNKLTTTTTETSNEEEQKQVEEEPVTRRSFGTLRRRPVVRPTTERVTETTEEAQIQTDEEPVTRRSFGTLRRRPVIRTTTERATESTESETALPEETTLDGEPTTQRSRFAIRNRLRLNQRTTTVKTEAETDEVNAGSATTERLLDRPRLRGGSRLRFNQRTTTSKVDEDVQEEDATESPVAEVVEEVTTKRQFGLRPRPGGSNRLRVTFGNRRTTTTKPQETVTDNEEQEEEKQEAVTPRKRIGFGQRRQFGQTRTRITATETQQETDAAEKETETGRQVTETARTRPLFANRRPFGRTTTTTTTSTTEGTPEVVEEEEEDAKVDEVKDSETEAVETVRNEGEETQETLSNKDESSASTTSNNQNSSVDESSLELVSKDVDSSEISSKSQLEVPVTDNPLQSNSDLVSLNGEESLKGVDDVNEDDSSKDVVDKEDGILISSNRRFQNRTSVTTTRFRGDIGYQKVNAAENDDSSTIVNANGRRVKVVRLRRPVGRPSSGSVESDRVDDSVEGRVIEARGRTGEETSEGETIVTQDGIRRRKIIRTRPGFRRVTSTTTEEVHVESEDNVSSTTTAPPTTKPIRKVIRRLRPKQGDRVTSSTTTAPADVEFSDRDSSTTTESQSQVGVGLNRPTIRKFRPRFGDAARRTTAAPVETQSEQVEGVYKTVETQEGRVRFRKIGQRGKETAKDDTADTETETKTVTEETAVRKTFNKNVLTANNRNRFRPSPRFGLGARTTTTTTTEATLVVEDDEDDEEGEEDGEVSMEHTSGQVVGYQATIESETQSTTEAPTSATQTIATTEASTTEPVTVSEEDETVTEDTQNVTEEMPEEATYTASVTENTKLSELEIVTESVDTATLETPQAESETEVAPIEEQAEEFQSNLEVTTIEPPEAVSTMTEDGFLYESSTESDGEVSSTQPSVTTSKPTEEASLLSNTESTLSSDDASTVETVDSSISSSTVEALDETSSLHDDQQAITGSSEAPTPSTVKSKLFASRRPYRPTRPSIQALTSSTESTVSTPKTFVRKHSSTFNLPKLPSEAQDTSSIINQEKTTFSRPIPLNINRFRNKFRLSQGEKKEEDKEYDYEKDKDKGEGNENDEEYEDDEDFTDDDDEEEEGVEEQEEEEEGDETTKPPVNRFTSRREKLRKQFAQRQGNVAIEEELVTSTLEDTSSSVSITQKTFTQQNRFGKFKPTRPTNKPRVVNSPVLLTGGSQGTQKSNSVNIPSPGLQPNTTPGAFRKSKTRNYERKYSATSTESTQLPQDLLLEEINIDAINARNKKIFEINSRKHTTSKPKPKIITEITSESETDGAVVDYIDTEQETHTNQGVNTDANINQSTQLQENTLQETLPPPASTSVLEATTATPKVTLQHVFSIDTSEATTEPGIDDGSIVTDKRHEKLVEINRIVEINSKENKLKFKTKDQTTERYETSDLKIEQLPTIDKIGEIHRVTLVKLVESAKNRNEYVGPKSINFGSHSDINVQGTTTKIGPTESVPHAIYFGENSQRQAVKEGRTLLLPELIFGVETSTIPLEGLFESERKSKKYDGDSNSVQQQSVVYATSLGEVPAVKLNSDIAEAKVSILSELITQAPIPITPPTPSTTTTTTTPPSTTTTTEATKKPITYHSTSSHGHYTSSVESRYSKFRPQNRLNGSRRPAFTVRKRITTPAPSGVNADELETTLIPSTLADRDRDRDASGATIPSGSGSSVGGFSKYVRRSRPTFAALTSKNADDLKTQQSLSEITDDNQSSSPSPNAFTPRIVVRRKFNGRPIANRRTTSSPEELELTTITEPPRTTNPLFKRRFSTSITTPLPERFDNDQLVIVTTTPRAFTTPAADAELEEDATEDDMDQQAGSSVQDTKFLNNRYSKIGEQRQANKIKAEIDAAVKNITSIPEIEDSTQPITRRIGLSATRRPSGRRPQKTTTTTAAPSATPQLRRRKPSKPQAFEKINPGRPGRTYRPIVDYDYYDDEDVPLVSKTSSQVKVILHGRGIIECLDQGNFPHPLSCKKFISCAKMETGGVVGWEYTCPKGLSYDPVGGICNWAAGLGCKE